MHHQICTNTRGLLRKSFLYSYIKGPKIRYIVANLAPRFFIIALLLSPLCKPAHMANIMTIS
jgi:hypothetical protein